MLASICATYLMSNTVKLKFGHSDDGLYWTETPREDPDIFSLLVERPFLNHAATHLLKYAESLSGTSQALDLVTELLTKQADYDFWVAIHYMRIPLQPSTSPLFWAIGMMNKTDMIQALLARGVDVNAVNNWGETLLHVAVQHGNLALVKLLLTFNPDVGKQPKGYRSPLHSAVRGNRIEIARLLLAHNADRLAPDVAGLIPLPYVRSPEMVDLLLEDLSVQQLGRVDEWGCPPWKGVLRDANCSPSIMPTFDALIRAIPEHMVDQLQSSVQDLEVVLAKMEGADFVRWTGSGSVSSSFEALHHVLDVMRQKITS